MNMNNHSRGQPFCNPRKQYGVALYIAIIMLLLLTLLGIAAVQVSSMQERMAGNFNTLNLSFQNAEEKIRFKEFDLKKDIELTGAFVPPLVTGGIACSQDVDAWAAVREIDEDSVTCLSEIADTPSDSLSQGQNPVNEEFRSFQLYSSAVDRYQPGQKIQPESASTVTVIETVFIP